MRMHHDDGQAEKMCCVPNTGNWHVMADGRKLSYSLVNNTASDFSIPRQYCVRDVLALGSSEDSGFGAANSPAEGYSPSVAHFLALCMKLVYEEEDIIRVENAMPCLDDLLSLPALILRTTDQC